MLNLYSILDLKAKAYSPPFTERTSGLAIRGFTALANDQNTTICKYPTDFQLYHIGTYDEETGITTCADPFIPLGFAYEYQDEPVPNPTQLDIEELIQNGDEPH